MPRIDKGLATALAVGAALRIGALEAWSRRPCVRDECTYRDLAASILRGEGMVGTRGWLWAPGYPSLIAAHAQLVSRMNAVMWTQVAVALLTVGLLWRFTYAHFGARAATIAAFLLALNPTHVFYASSLWSECFYTALLFGLVTAVGWVRHEPPGGTAPPPARTPWGRAAILGALLGACVLFRGVATYLLPCVALALVWGRWRVGVAWRSALAMALAAAVVVAPYSAYASRKFGAFVISDRTLGQMMWLGDNDYPPISFDYGNGPLSDEAFDAITATGRAHCPFEKDPAQQDACEVRNGLRWIEANPGTFLARIPLRLAQMFTPHSLLTRNLRSGRWAGLPALVDEAIIVAVADFSMLTVIGGVVGGCARGRGWFAASSSLIVAYHMAAIACLAGLSRYRVPLEPLGMVYAAGLLADPAAAFAALRSSRGRAVAAGVLGLGFLALMLWFLPAGWKGWRTW